MQCFDLRGVMPDYQVIARKFRPQFFKEVIGQEAIVKTLKNAIKYQRLSQAYLFCGSRGTGKTTLARLLAKAINCHKIASDYEPCNQCPSCHEIVRGNSLDVLEIDGASHRGIEDIRQINETVGYAVCGHYKIYIIDEVHMLTKEAFNALLKTLEEPPPKVKFFFATTEPHKIPPTILSRCQRFNLRRIPLPLIISKLRDIANQLSVEVEEEALCLLAQHAEGGLRDAESLFDQILAFEEGCITIDSITAVLGLMPREIYFEIDQAGKQAQFAKAFEIAQRVFFEGKDISFFIEGLIDHLRNILFIKVTGAPSSLIVLSESEKKKYLQVATFYSSEQCLDLIEYLLDVQNQLRTTTFVKTYLEMILLHVMRSHFRLPVEQLVQHLSKLEQLINEKSESTSLQLNPSTPSLSADNKLPSITLTTASNPPKPSVITQEPSTAKSNLMNIVATRPSVAPTLFDKFTSEDPSPSSADLGKNVELTKLPPSQTSSTTSSVSCFSSNNMQRPLHIYDTLMHFAAVELNGRLQKN